MEETHYVIQRSRKFIRFCDSHYDKIYSFEPDADNFRQFISESDRASGVDQCGNMGQEGRCVFI